MSINVLFENNSGWMMGPLLFLMNCTNTLDEPSSALKYYRDKLTPQNTVQIVGDLKRSFDVKGIRVTNPIDYFQQPPWESEPLD
jgi:hypothetical protein